MTILGISAFYHDAAAALIRDGRIVAAAQEERFTRKKHDPAFPTHSIRFCLEYAGCRIDDLDAIVFYDKPFLKFERLLETYYAFAPKGLVSFLKAMPVWMNEKLFLKRILYKELQAIGDFDRKKVRLLFPEHHLSHAASAFYPSPFEEAAILTIDGVGEWATASIGKGQGNRISVIKELDFPHSVGLLYSSFTYYCGFEVNEGEYKLMGLAPFGNKAGPDYPRYLHLIRTRMITLFDDGSVFLHQEYFRYATGLRMTADRHWEKLFDLPRRQPESPLEQRYCDLALAIQTITEEIVEKMAAHARDITRCRYLCLAGGVALNVVTNARLRDSGMFEDIFIQPAAGDAGGSLGAALAGYYIYFDRPREGGRAGDMQQGSLLGPAFDDTAIEPVVKAGPYSYRYFEKEEDLIRETARLLASGAVIGWHQGRMEFGPRALGARSILADARDPGTQRQLNLKIKFREGFRPFAPVIPLEDVGDYFDRSAPSPYMLFVSRVLPDRCNPLPEDYSSWDIMKKLYFLRSDIPAVTHVDYSARVQTVEKETNGRLWKLLKEFGSITGYPLLVNTSFNIRGEPIVNSPGDAYRCFANTNMDCLVIGNYIVIKTP